MSMTTTTHDYLNGSRLQDWYSIEIEQVGDTYCVYFLSQIHVNKRKRMNPQFSTQFTKAEVLRDSDLLRNIHRAYGKVTVT